MNISVFGLGYVGCVSLGCLANNGHKVIGVDTNKTKTELINQGLPTIIEKDIDVIVRKAHSKGKIKATNNCSDAVKNSDISIICVGTPSTEKGHLDLSYVFNTARQIGNSLRTKKGFHIVSIRSTVLPGTNEEVGKIIEEISGKRRNDGFAIISNPEFLREGSAVYDYYHPALTIVGCDNDQALDIYLKIFSRIKAPVERTTIQIAEIIKYVNNSYHALKIVFANEIGNICKALNIDSHEVMRIFCMDTRLNISADYFIPGSAYGGSCLPKDLKALKTISHDNYLETPVIDSIEKSNENQKKIISAMIEKSGKSRILFLGISFKAGTDDLRQSPVVSIIEFLFGKGFQIKVYDKNINLSKLVGGNKNYITEKLSHLDNLLISDVHKGLEWADLIVLTKREKEFESLIIPEKKEVIDLVRIPHFEKHTNYKGLLW